MNAEMHKAIKLLNEHSLSVISGDRQIKNGTIMVQDDFLGTRYTIHESGYARKRVFGDAYYMVKFKSPGQENNHYQLNKTIKIKKNYQWNGRPYVATRTKRILLPGEYTALAEMVVKAANRERKNNL